MAFDPIKFARQNISYHTDVEWPTDFSKVNYVMRGNGLWEVRQNQIGIFYNLLHECNIGGFPKEEFEESFVELALPRIPREMLNQIIAFFRKLTEKHDFEAYVQVVWDKNEQTYKIICPKQVVSKARVQYVATNPPPHQVIVLDIHSHNSMNAFFSGVDDSDERKRGDRFFGVVGKLDMAEPQIKLSFILGGGERVMVDLEVLFEEETFPSEWLDQVEFEDRLPNAELARKSDQYAFPRVDSRETPEEFSVSFDEADLAEPEQDEPEPETSAAQFAQERKRAEARLEYKRQQEFEDLSTPAKFSGSRSFA